MVWFGTPNAFWRWHERSARLVTDPQQTHRDILSKVMGGETLPTPEPEPEPETEAAATTDWKSEVANLVHDLDGVTVEQAWGALDAAAGGGVVAHNLREEWRG